jgi:PAS domain S-box-containing protein
MKRSMRSYINETPNDYRDSYGGLHTHQHLVWTASPEGEIIPVDNSWEEFTGLPQAEWQSLVHPEEHEEFATKWSDCLRSGEDFSHIHRLKHKDGEYFWMHARGFPFRDSKGRIIYWYGTTENVHGRIMSQMERDTIYAEVDHRSKNLLQVVRGLVRLAPRDGSIENFVDTLDERLTSLSSAYSLLAESHWQTVEMHDLLERELAPFRDRVSVSGPQNVKILHSYIQPLSMVIHELATNAVKYGGLSVPEGRLTIEMNCNEMDLHVRWIESGGPVATAPNRSGFGTKLIERSKSYVRVEYHWLDTGLIIDLHCSGAVGQTAS